MDGGSKIVKRDLTAWGAERYTPLPTLVERRDFYAKESERRGKYTQA